MEDAGHFPVLLEAVVEMLAPAGRHVIIDCTVGQGGHAEALLEAAGREAVLIGLDVDRSNLLKTKERLARFGSRVRLFEANFADLDEVLAEAGRTRADAVVADLGVASSQLDDPARGFSFQVDGPLDMRMGGEGPTAADLVGGLSERELAELFRRYGQERNSRRIAAAVVRARRRERIVRTTQLARIIAAAALGRRPGRRRIHPATRCFLALRIAVNHELDNLRRLLEKLPALLSVGGRAAVISFHSLEDGPVKRAFAAAARAGSHRVLTPKPRRPTDEEVARNPRSRSGKLRAIERIR